MLNFIFKSWFIKILVVINFIGTLWGFWWYHLQLATTPVYWWFFVPDSPLSSGLFTIALILILLDIRKPWFHLLACFLSIKYGLWAVAMILDFWNHGGTVQVTEIMLVFSHLAMAIEAVIYLTLSWPDKFSWIPFVIYTWLNDGADYIFSMHPYFFYDGQETFGMQGVLLLSSTLTVLALTIAQFKKGQRYEF